jgi:tetratricopeptide (TPR) repeat protein
MSDRYPGGVGISAFVADPIAAFAGAETKLTRALSLVPDHARGHATVGHVEIVTKHAAEGIAELEHALRLDRNLASAHALIGLGKMFIGRAEETEAHVVEALRLSPHDTMAYGWMAIVGLAKNFLGSWEQAIVWSRRAVEANRNHPHGYLYLATALDQLGRVEEAHSAVKGALTLHPTLTMSRARAIMTAASDDPAYVVQLERFLEGLRKAGVPEG